MIGIGALGVGLGTRFALGRVLKDGRRAPTRTVEPLRLAGQSPAVLLVVGQDVQHGLPLVGEALVELAQIAHDVEHGAALVVAFPQAALQRLHMRAESLLGRHGRAGVRDRRLTLLRRRLWHPDYTLSSLSLSTWSAGSRAPFRGRSSSARGRRLLPRISRDPGSSPGAPPWTSPGREPPARIRACRAGCRWRRSPCRPGRAAPRR